MPRHKNYIEWTPADDEEVERPTPRTSYPFDKQNPFDDPEVRQRMAELIARSVRTKKSRA